jgi:hypothetical protein
MLETYTIKRETDGCKTSYFVTVESFDTNLESAEAALKNDISTQREFSAEELYQLWRSGKAEQLLAKHVGSPRLY